MAIRALSLSIDSYTASVFRFIGEGGYSRVPVGGGDVRYSLSGTSLIDGTLYEPKYVWTISTLVTTEEKAAINALWMRSERKRRQLQDSSILLHDSIEPFVEDATTRSRALATGGSVVTLDTGGISYPAQFKVRITEPKFTMAGSSQIWWQCSFVAKELDKVPA